MRADTRLHYHCVTEHQYQDPTANILAALRDYLYVMEEYGSQAYNFTLKRYERDPSTNQVSTLEEHINLVDLLSLPHRVVMAALIGEQSEPKHSDAYTTVIKKLKAITTYLDDYNESKK